jgi:hypothetical protein
MRYDDDAWNECATSVLEVDHYEAFRCFRPTNGHDRTDYGSVSLFEYYVDQLVEHGMSKKQADDVACISYKDFINNSVNNGYSPDFRSPFDVYSQCERDAYWIVFKRCAIEYIDKNCPDAWFREMLKEPDDE